jgi:recombinational DNA repair protein (RecF pathway)
MAERQTALVLCTEHSGESFLKLHLLSAEQGIFLCLKRISRKAKEQTSPDLFDSAEVILESSQQGTMRFVKEYHLTLRRAAIGQSYQNLRCASRLAQLLVTNANHLPESTVLFDLTERALDAFAENKSPPIVILKSLYLLLKEEGHPVRESWWPQLPPSLRESARDILGAPVPRHCDEEKAAHCAAIEASLIRWMRHHSDWIVPG